MYSAFVSMVVIFTAATQLTGYEIMERVVNAGRWHDLKGAIELTLVSSSGEVKKREMDFYTKRYEADLSRMIMILKAPPEVKGMAFLLIERKEGDDERYLYLPAMRVVRRIEASGKGGSFMSSDFSYYDIGGVKLRDWTFQLKGEEEREGQDVYVVEALPANRKVEKETGYSKIEYEIRKDIFLIWHAYYYNRAGVKFKEYKLNEFHRLDDGSVIAVDFEMKNLVTAHRSRIRFVGLEVNTGVPDKLLTVRALRRR